MTCHNHSHIFKLTPFSPSSVKHFRRCLCSAGSLYFSLLDPSQFHLKHPDIFTYINYVTRHIVIDVKHSHHMQEGSSCWNDLHPMHGFQEDYSEKRGLCWAEPNFDQMFICVITQTMRFVWHFVYYCSSYMFSHLPVCNDSLDATLSRHKMFSNLW